MPAVLLVLMCACIIRLAGMAMDAVTLVRRHSVVSEEIHFMESCLTIRLSQTQPIQQVAIKSSWATIQLATAY